jgi:hypothetical protein
MRKLLRQRWIAVVLFLIGFLHLLIVHQTYQPNEYVNHETPFPFHASDADVDGLTMNPMLSPPTRVVVLGERESGVDHVVEVIDSAFQLDVSKHPHITRQTQLTEAELKHISSQTDILWIIVVRTPCEWAESMLQLKRDVCEKNNVLQNKGLKSCNVDQDSYNFQWDDWLDVGHDVEEIIPTEKGTTMKHQHIFEMRRQNLLILQQFMELIPRHVKIVRYGEFELNPNALVKDLEKEYNFTLNKDHIPITMNANSTPSLCMNYNKWKEAQNLIDWTVEGYFGHHSLDCHLCYGQADSIPNDVDAPSIIYLLGEFIIMCIASRFL